MAEKIVMTNDILKYGNIVGWALITAATETSEELKAKTGSFKTFDKLFLTEREGGENTPYVFNVEFRIDGHEVSFTHVMSKMIKQYDASVRQTAKDLIRSMLSNYEYRLIEELGKLDDDE